MPANRASFVSAAKGDGKVCFFFIDASLGSGDDAVTGRRAGFLLHHCPPPRRACGDRGVEFRMPGSVVRSRGFMVWGWATVADHVQLLFDQPLDVAQRIALRRVAEGNGDAGVAGARGAADAVDIVLGTSGSSKLTTWVTSSISMPRAAMSVATSMRARPLRNSSSARWRAFCDLLPWMASAAWPDFLEMLGDLVGAMLGAREDDDARHRPHRAAASCSSARLSLVSTK